MYENRPLIGYLPNVLREVREFQLLVDSEEPELDELWDRLQEALDDQFIEYLTEHGAGRWEKILKINPEKKIEDRRDAIAARLRVRLPFTLKMLHVLLTEILGEGKFEIELIEDKYMLRLHLYAVGDNDAKNASFLMRRICPANLTSAVAQDISAYNKVFVAGALLQTTYNTVKGEVQLGSL